MVIDATKQAFTLSSGQIQELANRRLGVGFDQMLVLEKPKNADCDFHLRIFNADGGEVGQCGNGARCIAHFIRELKLSPKSKFKVSTITENLALELENGGKVRVALSVPRFAPKEIPFIADHEDLFYEIDVGGKKVKFSVVNVGNPHAVIRVDAIDSREVGEIGALLTKHERFPEEV